MAQQEGSMTVDMRLSEVIEADDAKLLATLLSTRHRDRAMMPHDVLNRCLFQSIECKSTQCAGYLLGETAAGLDLNYSDVGGATALMLAVVADLPDVISRLLELGADPYRRNSDEHSALDLACRSNNLQCMQALLAAHPGTSLTPALAYSALVSAAGCGHQEALLALIKAGLDINLNLDSHTGSALHVAVEADSLCCVQALLSAKADIEILRLHTAQPPLAWAAELGSVDIVRALLQAGCDVNRETENYSTPLTIACHYGQTKVLHLLLDHGADPHRKNRWGFTPLYLGTDCLPIIKTLLQHGVSVTEQSGDRAEAPLHLASVIGCPQTTQLLLEAGADINVKTVYNETALWLAAWKDNEDVARQLIQLNCEVDVASNGYQVYVWEYLPVEVALGSANYPITRMLLEAGCSRTNTRYFSTAQPGPIAALPGLRLRKEVFDLVQMDRSAFHWLCGVCQNAPALRSQCRLVIRRSIGRNLQHLVNKLPLPPVMKLYLMMNDF